MNGKFVAAANLWPPLDYKCSLGQILTKSSYTTSHSEKNAAVFHFLYTACVDGTASIEVAQHDTSKNGHGAWKDLVDRYMGKITTLDRYAEKIENDLAGLILDKNITAFEYINSFMEYIGILCHRNGDKTSPPTVISEFFLTTYMLMIILMCQTI